MLGIHENQMTRDTRFRSAPDMTLPADAPNSAKRVEFGRRLEAHMNRKGWNQSELSRQAQKHMPKGKTIGRDSISNYIRGSNFPNPVNLDALCKALGTQPVDLVPGEMFLRAKEDMPPLDVRGLGDGSAWLRINQRVPMAKALKILEILNTE